MITPGTLCWIVNVPEYVKELNWQIVEVTGPRYVGYSNHTHLNKAMYPTSPEIKCPCCGQMIQAFPEENLKPIIDPDKEVTKDKIDELVKA